MKKMLCALSVAILVAMSGFGCGGKNEDTENEEKSLEDYKQQAQDEITAENAESELQKLEKQMEAESE